MQEGTQSDSTGVRQRDRRASRTLLLAAVAVTAIGAIAAYVLLAGLFEYPGTQNVPVLPTSDATGSAPLVVAVARTPGGPGEWANWARIIKYMSEELERPVTVRYLSNESEASEIIAKDKVDIAFVCAHHYLDLTDSGDVIGICTPIIAGDSMSRSLLIVRADDPATSFDDLKGKPVAVSDKSSLGGYAYLSYLVKQRNQPLAEYFSELKLGDTQESNIHDLISGTTSATVVNSAQVVSWDMSQFKVIEQSPKSGCPPVVVDSEMDPALRQAIVDILLEMDVSEVLPDDTTIDGFIPLNPADYDFAKTLRGACGHHDHPING